MSNVTFPTLPGIAWGIKKAPLWNTGMANASSGRQFVSRKRVYPLWRFKIPVEFLRAQVAFSEWQTLVGFINARNGRYDDFLYLDPRDNFVTAQQIGVGDGVTVRFPLVRSIGGFVEPVGFVNTVASSVYVNGVGSPLASWDDNFTVAHFITPPPAGSIVTWTGQFLFRCRFLSDEIELEQFIQDYWKVNSIDFQTFRP